MKTRRPFLTPKRAEVLKKMLKDAKPVRVNPKLRP